MTTTTSDALLRLARLQQRMRVLIVDARGDATASTSRSAAAYGRAAIIRSCARRSFAAETIFMALVICCVFLTLRMRRRMSIVLGMCRLRRDGVGVVLHVLRP